MRIATVLSPHDLPTAELQAGILDGELVRVGAAYCAIDTIIGSEHRARSIAVEVPSWSIAERLTAAWVYGVGYEQPGRLHLCVTSKENVRPHSTLRYAFREVVLGTQETCVLGGLRVTTPMRTALDIARTDDEFAETTRDVVRCLATVGRGFTLDDCVAEIRRRRNLPYKTVAITRLSLALGGASPAQPAVTR